MTSESSPRRTDPQPGWKESREASKAHNEELNSFKAEIMRIIIDDAIMAKNQLGFMYEVLNNPERPGNILKRWHEVNRQCDYNVAMAELGLIGADWAEDKARLRSRIEQVESILARMVEDLGGGG